MNNNNPTQRLVEYFLVVGIDDLDGLRCAVDASPGGYGQQHDAGLLSSPGGSTEDGETTADEADRDEALETMFKISVLSRYPETDHPDVPFPSGVSMFCFPDGGVRCKDHMEMPRFFEFVSTGENGAHIFGFVLLIYEPIERALYTQEMVATGKMYHAPKCLCLLSHWPFRSQFRSFLTELYRLSISPVSQPLERVVSNFVSEVPLPPAGKIRVQSQIGTAELTFTRPPANNPISWTDIGFQQVFECLDLPNVLKVFSALLTERQILVRSSQLSLLAACGEVFRALMYPFVWSHVYIPVLPYAMLMVIQAPLPYLIGVHEDTLHQAIAEGYEIPPTAVVVDLDRNAVSVSSKDFAVLDLPLHDMKKLMARVHQCAPAFEQRTRTWAEDELPYMDLAISHAARPYEIDDDTAAHVRKVAQSGSDFDASGTRSVWCTLPDGSCNWPLVRTAFFRFFVSILRDYREFLVYPVQKPGSPRKRALPSRAQRDAANGSFNADAFLSRRRRASERTFMALLVNTQHFGCFIDDRLHPDGAHDADVVFFEQSLEAKFNRNFLTKLIPGMKNDTPFLDDRQYSISKTVVANGPDQSPTSVPAEAWMPADPQRGFERFPRLRPALFGDIRPMPETGAGKPGSDGLLTSKPRLLRPSQHGGQADEDLGSASDAIYATWFVLFCSAIGRQTENWADIETYDARLAAPSGRLSVVSSSSVQTLTDAEAECGGGAGGRESTGSAGAFEGSSPTAAGKVGVMRPRAASGSAKDVSSPDRPQRLSVSSVDEAKRAETSLIDLATAFEVLETSQQWSNAVDEVVYRALIDACGRCGATDHAIRVLGMMHESGVTVDSLIYSNLVQSFSMNGDARSFKMDILDWKKLRQEVKAANQRIELSMRELAHRSFASGSSSQGHRSRRHHMRTHSAHLRSRKGTLLRQLQSPKKQHQRHHSRGSSLSSGSAMSPGFGHRRGGSGPAPNAASFGPDSSASGSFASASPQSLRGYASTGTPLPSVRRTMQHWGSRSRASEDGASAAGSESNQSADTSDARRGSRWGFLFGGGSGSGKASSGNLRKDSSAGGDEFAHKKAAPQGLSPVSSVGTPGESAQSPAPIAVRLVAAADPPTLSDDGGPGPGGAGERLDLDHVFPDLEIDTERETCPQCNKAVRDEDIRRGWDMDPNDYNTECPACARKFVAFFTVYSPDEAWEGSRGAGTPLFCEFLPPWALSKEVRSILDHDSIDFVCCREFRLRKPTVFWNLVLYFSEFSLPLEFLTGPPAVEPDLGDFDAISLNAIGSRFIDAESDFSTDGERRLTGSETLASDDGGASPVLKDSWRASAAGADAAGGGGVVVEEADAADVLDSHHSPPPLIGGGTGSSKKWVLRAAATEPRSAGGSRRYSALSPSASALLKKRSMQSLGSSPPSAGASSRGARSFTISVPDPASASFTSRDAKDAAIRRRSTVLPSSPATS